MGQRSEGGRDDGEDIAAQLEQSRAELMDAMAGLDEAGFRARPDSAAWTAAEVLAHLLDTERTLRAHAQAALDRRDYVVNVKTNVEHEESARRAQRMAVPQLVHGLLAERRDTHHALAACTEHGLRHRLQHEALGELTIGGLFRHLSEHESAHANQIRELRQATMARDT